MPAEVTMDTSVSKSIFTKDADEAFDEFCRKYLNADSGFFRQSFKNTGKLRGKHMSRPPHVKDIFNSSTASIDKSSTQAQPTPTSTYNPSLTLVNKKDPYASFYQNIYDYNQEKAQQQQYQHQNGYQMERVDNDTTHAGIHEHQKVDSNLNYYNQILNKHNTQHSNKQKMILQYDEPTKTYICKIDSAKSPPPPPLVLNGATNKYQATITSITSSPSGYKKPPYTESNTNQEAISSGYSSMNSHTNGYHDENKYTNIYTGMSEEAKQSSQNESCIIPVIEQVSSHAKSIRSEFKNGSSKSTPTSAHEALCVQTEKSTQTNKQSFLSNFKNIDNEVFKKQEQQQQQQHNIQIETQTQKNLNFRHEFANNRRKTTNIINGPFKSSLEQTSTAQRNLTLENLSIRQDLSLLNGHYQSGSSTRHPLGLKVVACGMPKDTRLPIPKQNFFIDKGNFGDDAGFWSENAHAAAIGLADGATGNIMLGYDPGEFPRYLMKLCSSLFLTTQSLKCPKELLLKAFDILQDRVCYGSCTACILTLDHETQVLKIANVGDSGYRLIRNGKIVRKSEPQRFASDCPKQLDSYPWKAESRKMGVCYTDIIAEDTVCDSVKIQKDDVIILSSDGLYDNIEDNEIEDLFNRSKTVQDAAERLVTKALKNNIKPDDILLIVGKIVENKESSNHAIFSRQSQTQ